ncbi:MAG: YdaS family helix-turn-helix protein [Methylovirgula sp.]|nr:YdaS family helix-turn-helix protein [Methylovirgula sp.]
MDDSDIMRIALQEAVKVAGSQAAFARRRGVSQPTVFDWLNRMKRLPAEHVLATEADTGISRYRLRPDIYPIEETRSPPSDGAGAPGGSAVHPSGVDPVESARA